MDLPGDAVTRIIGAAAGDHLSEGLALDPGHGVPGLIFAATFADVSGQQDSGLVYELTPLMEGEIDLARASLPTLGGADAGDQFGHSLGAIDRDADGVDDVLVGSVSADGAGNGEDLAGEAHLFLGPFAAGRTPADADSQVIGPAAEARLGRSLTAGEFDGRVGGEFVIAATDVEDRRGEVYILFGDAPIPDRADAARLTLQGMDPDDILGHESFGMPPLSAVQGGAGKPALLVLAAPGGDGPADGRTDCGEIYLIDVAGLRD
jgi:hypothetical protein